MKAVILLAGMGRRMKGAYEKVHKSLIPLEGKPLLEYLFDNLRKAGILDVIPIIGYQADAVLSCMERCSSGFSVRPVFNPRYAEANNLVSLVSAEAEIGCEDFILINGDMVFDWNILLRMKKMEHTCVAVDMLRKKDSIDSPRVLSDGRILDLGRHIPLEDSIGYAIGIYRFLPDFIPDFFTRAHDYIEKDPRHGFHDPLHDLSADHEILPVDIGILEWKDIDDLTDIQEAARIVRRLYG